MKKRIKPGSILLALNLVILAAMVWTFYQTYQLKMVNQSGFHPIVTNAHENTSVGQLRVSRYRARNSTFGTCEPPRVVEVREHVPGGGTSYENHDLLRVWLEDPAERLGEDYDFKLYHYCEEDGFWYMVYSPGYSFRGLSFQLAEKEEEFDVPSDVLAEPGKYMIEIEDIGGYFGACTFQLPLE